MPSYEIGYDNLIAGMVTPFTTVSVIVKSGATVHLSRGTVLGVVDQVDTGQYAGTYIVAPVDSTKSDGSQTPFAILADDDVDATADDQRATAYVSGEFNRDALKFGGSDTIDTHEAALRKIGIITKRVVK
ncbi:head decoration protein [Brevibacillus nitrificans]|uniref:head decoration protein n=1 Tax=Brevibacillus nitrificans TaxID=651560 RepID=UPI00285D3EAD|nr:head decoration protein [Brevibacillus nitrificans]MDR7318908.1 hypothetical protein [Brevibacillus nitrificans]